MPNTRVINLVRAMFFAATLILPLVYFIVVDPKFEQPNTFEDGQGYLTSGQRLLSTGSPYEDFQLAGPYGAVTASDTYRYPPPFAQVTALAVETGTGSLLLALIVVTNFLAALVLARSRSQVALALWLGFAFLPDWFAAWEGQVSGLLAISLAIALCEVPAGILAGAILKVIPIAALPAALVRMPRAVLISVAVAVPFLAASVIASPRAWTQFPTVVVNEFLGGGDYESLAPHGFARYLILAVVAAAVLASLVLARKRWPVAFYLGVVAGLLGPAFLPKYGLTILVPFLFVGMTDAKARLWAFAAFIPLALPFTSFSIPFLFGLGLLGMSMWRLDSTSFRWRSEPATVAASAG